MEELAKDFLSMHEEKERAGSAEVDGLQGQDARARTLENAENDTVGKGSTQKGDVKEGHGKSGQWTAQRQKNGTKEESVQRTH